MDTDTDALLVEDLRSTGEGRCIEAADTIERLTRERDEAMADAARYRWLRSNFTTDHRAIGLHACETPERLDAHLDAAIRTTTATN